MLRLSPSLPPVGGLTPVKVPGEEAFRITISFADAAVAAHPPGGCCCHPSGGGLCLARRMETPITRGEVRGRGACTPTPIRIRTPWAGDVTGKRVRELGCCVSEWSYSAPLHTISGRAAGRRRVERGEP